MGVYYAVCDANGPISRRITAGDPAAAMAQLRAANTAEWCDTVSTDAERDLGVRGCEGMEPREFSEQLQRLGWDTVGSYDGWDLWGRAE